MEQQQQYLSSPQQKEPTCASLTPNYQNTDSDLTNAMILQQHHQQPSKASLDFGPQDSTSTSKEDSTLRFEEEITDTWWQDFLEKQFGSSSALIHSDGNSNASMPTYKSMSASEQNKAPMDFGCYIYHSSMHQPIPMNESTMGEETLITLSETKDKSYSNVTSESASTYGATSELTSGQWSPNKVLLSSYTMQDTQLDGNKQHYPKVNLQHTPLAATDQILQAPTEAMATWIMPTMTIMTASPGSQSQPEEIPPATQSASPQTMEKQQSTYLVEESNWNPQQNSNIAQMDSQSTLAISRMKKESGQPLTQETTLNKYPNTTTQTPYWNGEMEAEATLLILQQLMNQQPPYIESRNQTTSVTGENWSPYTTPTLTTKGKQSQTLSQPEIPLCQKSPESSDNGIEIQVNPDKAISTVYNPLSTDLSTLLGDKTWTNDEAYGIEGRMDMTMEGMIPIANPILNTTANWTRTHNAVRTFKEEEEFLVNEESRTELEKRMKKDIQMFRGKNYDRILAYFWGREIVKKYHVSVAAWKIFGQYWRKVCIKTYQLYQNIEEDMESDQYPSRKISRMTQAAIKAKNKKRRVIKALRQK
ncbi:6251_t:CDS:2, partial [Paraglomus brasilianum]